MADNTQSIYAKGLTKQFGNLTAVNNLDLTVYKGEIFGIVGPDGAGKTTTLRMLSGISDPTGGNAWIYGFDVSKESAKVKDHLAYMSQKFGLYVDLTVKENIDFYADLYGVHKKERIKRIDELLDFSNMKPFKSRLAGNLSGGMKQKLQLVCALIHTPDVLLLDEPTNGVDPVSRRDFWRILYGLSNQNVSILLTTAYLDEAERCNRVGLLNNGKLMATGTPSEIRKLMQGKILCIRSSESRKINKLLKNNLKHSDINLFGDAVHVVSEQFDETEKLSRHLIESEGLKYDEISEVMPSLEDIFVSVLGHANKTNIEVMSDITTEKEKGGISVYVKNLTRHFGDFVAVNNISFEVQQGEIFGFLGPNGAGKSTTIRMLCGLLQPSDGTGTVSGFDINTQAEEIKKNIGYMSQKFSLYEDLTVEENIDFYGGIYGLTGKHLDERKKMAVQIAGLKDRITSRTSILSGGFKQRLALACAILHEPPIIFLDEPTSGVDPLSRRRFWDIIYNMADKGVTVFVTTHYMQEAEYCDRIALIYGGKIIALGTPTELKKQVVIEGKNLPSMEDVFISFIEDENRKKTEAL